MYLLGKVRLCRRPANTPEITLPNNPTMPIITDFINTVPSTAVLSQTSVLVELSEGNTVFTSQSVTVSSG